MPSNLEFLQVLFGDDSQWAHVTDFAYDPSNMPEDRSRVSWFGNYFSRYTFGEATNQYFTISTFYADDENRARRKKSLFRATHVIVLDDVKEKLSLEEAQKLPKPTWILETSNGSEQWGYKLSVPAEDRHRVDNLLDGLVESGLAPKGVDPGMKGVTRYVRLPDGINNKATKLVNGQPFKCRITEWSPLNTVTLEQLAEPFAINLDVQRREQRVDGAANISDHPLLHIPDVIKIKEERSDGRFDIVCPWVEEHTEESDSGSAVFTNSDGTIGFKCHHGACQGRTGKDLLNCIEDQAAGFGESLKAWQLRRAFAEFSGPTVATPPAAVAEELSFIDPPKHSEPSSATAVASTEVASTDGDVLREHMSMLRQAEPFTDEQRKLAEIMLKVTDSASAMDKVKWHNQVKDVMGWTKPELTKILAELRTTWDYDNKKDEDYLKDVIFIAEQNQFFDTTKGIFYTPDSFQNSFSHIDVDARKTALQNNMVKKVDKLDFAPKQPPVFKRGRLTIGNSWFASDEIFGHEGDVECWLEHFNQLGWGKYRKHIMQWMAFTILHPDIKINHMLLFGSPEGAGKDFILAPLVKAMRDYHTAIEGDELVSDFQEYAVCCKHLHVNEAELGDKREAMSVGNKIKRLAAAPPITMRCNLKGMKPVKITNYLSISMTTNSQLPLRLNSASRRIFALWSDLDVRDENDEMRPEWRTFWTDAWAWMNGGGDLAVINYLRTQVDLSDFIPGTAPPVTQFLRDIREASKTPMQQTVEAFIRRGVGCFRSDLVSVVDMADTFKAGPVTAEDLMYCDHQLFTPSKIGCIMRETPGHVALKAKRKSMQTRLWAVRNIEIYKAMGPAELMDEYDKQMQQAKSAVQLKAV